MLFVGIGSFVLLLIVVYLIAAPALRPDPAERDEEASGLRVRKEQLLADIRELDMDLATGKLDEADHRRFRAAALAEAAETLHALEGVARTTPTAGLHERDPEEGGDPFEALIAARKRTLETGAVR